MYSPSPLSFHRSVGWAITDASPHTHTNIHTTAAHGFLYSSGYRIAYSLSHSIPHWLHITAVLALSLSFCSIILEMLFSSLTRSSSLYIVSLSLKSSISVSPCRLPYSVCALGQTLRSDPHHLVELSPYNNKRDLSRSAQHIWMVEIFPFQVLDIKEPFLSFFLCFFSPLYSLSSLSNCLPEEFLFSLSLLVHRGGLSSDLPPVDLSISQLFYSNHCMCSRFHLQCVHVVALSLAL